MKFLIISFTALSLFATQAQAGAVDDAIDSVGSGKLGGSTVRSNKEETVENSSEKQNQEDDFADKKAD